MEKITRIITNILFFFIVAGLLLQPIVEPLARNPIVREVEPEPFNPVVTRAKNIYVSTTGNDLTGTGDIGTPYKTIWKANNVSVAGDTIILRGGTYTPTTRQVINQQGTAANWITYRNYAGETVIINGSSVPYVNYSSACIELWDADYIRITGINIKWSAQMGICVEREADYIVIDNLTIDNSSGSALKSRTNSAPAINTYLTFDNITIDNCFTDWSSRADVSQEVVSFSITNYFTVKYCTFKNNHAENIDVKAGANNGSIHHNWFNTTGGHLLKGGQHFWGGKGIYIDGFNTKVSNISIYNNYIEGNNSGIVISAEGATGTVSTVNVYNNLVTQNHRGIPTGSISVGPGIALGDNNYPTRNMYWVKVYCNTVIICSSSVYNPFGVYCYRQYYHECDIQNNIFIHKNNTANTAVAIGYIPRINSTNNTKTQVDIDYNNYFRVPGTFDKEYISWDDGILEVAAPVGGANSITTDPEFVSNSTGNYHLETSSPCIGLMNTSMPVPTYDYDDVGRPFNADYDIGCYECYTAAYVTIFPGVLYLNGYNRWAARQETNFTFITTDGVTYTNWTWGYGAGMDSYNTSWLHSLTCTPLSVQTTGGSVLMSAEIFAPTGWTVNEAYFSVYTPIGNLDQNVSAFTTFQKNSTRKLVNASFNPNDAWAGADLGLFDVRFWVNCTNTSLWWYGNTTYNDSFTVYSSSNISISSLSSQHAVIERDGHYNFGNYTTLLTAVACIPAAWTINFIFFRVYTAYGMLDANLSTYTVESINSTHRYINATYNPSNTLNDSNMGSFDVDVFWNVSNLPTYDSDNTTFNDVFIVYNLSTPFNAQSRYWYGTGSLNLTWGTGTPQTSYYRPNADTVDTDWVAHTVPPDYAEIDEVTPDGYTSYVFMPVYSWSDQISTFDIPNHPAASTGPITGITVVSRAQGYYGIHYNYMNILQIGGVNYWGTNVSLPMDWTFRNYYDTWYVDPSDGLPWTWADIDALEIGIYGDYVSGSFGSFGIICTQLYMVVNYYEPTWDNVSVVMRRYDAYPVSPFDTSATKVYNGSAFYYNETDNITTKYFSVWFYNNSTMSYSGPLYLPWGTVLINVYNESAPWLTISPFGLLVSNKAGTSVYWEGLSTVPVLLNYSVIPYGTQTIIKLNATDYRERIYYKNLYTNSFYNYSFYLPPIWQPTGESTEENMTQMYILTVINNLGYAVSDALVELKTYINSTNTFEVIASSYTDGAGQCQIWLVPGRLYKVYITADNYESIVGDDYVPSAVVFTKTFQLDPSSSSLPPPYIITDHVHLDCGMGGTTLYVNYTDNLGMTLAARVVVTEINAITGAYTVVGWNNQTLTSVFNAVFVGCNVSNDYKVYLWFNHTIFGEQELTWFYFGSHDFPIINPTYVEGLWVYNFGANPIGWTNLVGWFGVVAVMFSFGRKSSFMSMILVGILLLFLNVVIGFNDAFQTMAAVGIPLLTILLGGLMAWRDYRRERGIL